MTHSCYFVNKWTSDNPPSCFFSHHNQTITQRLVDIYILGMHFYVIFIILMCLYLDSHGTCKDVTFSLDLCFIEYELAKSSLICICTINSKINGTRVPQRCLLAHFEATHDFSRIANLLVHNNISISYYAQVNSLRLKSSVASKWTN